MSIEEQIVLRRIGALGVYCIWRSIGVRFRRPEAPPCYDRRIYRANEVKAESLRQSNVRADPENAKALQGFCFPYREAVLRRPQSHSERTSASHDRCLRPHRHTESRLNAFLLLNLHLHEQTKNEACLPYSHLFDRPLFGYLANIYNYISISFNVYITTEPFLITYNDFCIIFLKNKYSAFVIRLRMNCQRNIISRIIIQ
ncbi:hypothetical protein D3C78_1285650 [compost metagenome]